MVTSCWIHQSLTPVTNARAEWLSLCTRETEGEDGGRCRNDRRCLVACRKNLLPEGGWFFGLRLGEAVP
jgi:hypothetical protein